MRAGVEVACMKTGEWTLSDWDFDVWENLNLPHRVVRLVKLVSGSCVLFLDMQTQLLQI